MVFPIMEQLKKEKKYEKKSFLPTYATKKYRVGVQQTNIFFMDSLSYAEYSEGRKAYAH